MKGDLDYFLTEITLLLIKTMIDQYQLTQKKLTPQEATAGQDLEVKEVEARVVRQGMAKRKKIEKEAQIGDAVLIYHIIESEVEARIQTRIDVEAQKEVEIDQVIDGVQIGKKLIGVIEVKNTQKNGNMDIEKDH